MGTMDTILLATLGIGAIAAFVMFTDPGKQLLSQLMGTQYDPKTSPFARRASERVNGRGPLGTEDAREYLPKFIEDVTEDMKG